MKDIEDLKISIKKIGRNQLFAVLATAHDNQPYTSLVAFAITDDIKKLIFVTPRHTRKFEYIKKNSFVSFLIDNSSNSSTDVTEASGVTVTGTAHEAKNEEREKFLNLFISKHPNLKEFAESENSVIVCVDVKRYDIVESFKNVTMLEIGD